MCCSCKQEDDGKIKGELKCENMSVFSCGYKGDDCNLKTSICLNKVMPTFSDYPKFKLYKHSVCVRFLTFMFVCRWRLHVALQLRGASQAW